MELMSYFRTYSSKNWVSRKIFCLHKIKAQIKQEKSRVQYLKCNTCNNHSTRKIEYKYSRNKIIIRLIQCLESWTLLSGSMTTLKCIQQSFFLNQTIVCICLYAKNIVHTKIYCAFIFIIIE